MDIELIKVLVGAFGGGGIAIFGAWVMFKNYVSTEKRFHASQDDRIKALEKAARDCEDDRIAIHQEVRLLQSGVIRENTAAMRNLHDTIKSGICAALHPGHQPQSPDSK